MTFPTLMPDSILAAQTYAFQAESLALPEGVALSSLSGLQAAAAGWMNQRNFSAWSNHHFWYLTNELNRSKGVDIPALSEAWDVSLYAKRAEAFNFMTEALETADPDEPMTLRRTLEQTHLTAYHTDFYKGSLALFERYIRDVRNRIEVIQAESGYRVNIRHPSVTPAPCHSLIMASSLESVMRLWYSIPAVNTPLYEILWHKMGMETLSFWPHLLFMPPDSFDDLPSSSIPVTYHSWHRFNAYATVTHAGDPLGIYAAVHPDVIHPSLLHSSTEMVSVPAVGIGDMGRVGIWDVARFYKPVHKMHSDFSKPIESEVINPDLIRLTRLAQILCQLLTAYSNGKKGTRGIAKPRWSSSPANASHYKIFMANIDRWLEEV